MATNNITQLKPVTQDSVFNRLFSDGVCSKKITKTTAFGILRNICESIQDGDISCNSNFETDISLLLGFFQPSLPAKVKTPEQWVAKFAPKNDIRYYLCNVCYSDGHSLVATNGHILAKIQTALPEGFYDNKTLIPNVKMDAKYPDFQRVIDSAKNPKDLHAVEPSDEYKAINDKITAQRVGPAWVNKAYLDICLLAPNSEIFASDATSALYITSDWGESLIMPMKID